MTNAPSDTPSAGADSNPASGQRRFPRRHPRPLLGVVGLGLMAALILAAPVGLVGWRLMETRDAPSVLDLSRQMALNRVTIARAVEGLRGLARQIRHAPAGPAGADARRKALTRLRVLGSDPAWRAAVSPAFADALDEAQMAAMALSAKSASQTPWATIIADALDRIKRQTETGTPSGDAVNAADTADLANNRKSAITNLLAVLTTASHANAAALPVLEAHARRLAVRAIAAAPEAPPETHPETHPNIHLGALPFAVHRAIEDAMNIPAARRKALSDQELRDDLWRKADMALAHASDLALTMASQDLATVGDTLKEDANRLSAALLSLALATLATALLLVWRAIAGHALPLGRLARRADALGFNQSQSRTSSGKAWESLNRLVSATETDTDFISAAHDSEAKARRDAATLAAALLGAAPEAAVGRNLTGVSRSLDGTLDAVRAQATLALTESRLLATTSGGRRADVSSERAALAAHLVGEACAHLSERVDEAAHLVSALCLLSAPVANSTTRIPVVLRRVLRETVSVLEPRLLARGVRFDLRCPASATVEAAPGILTAVVCYIIEAAMLRAEDEPDATVPMSAIVLSVTLGSDARVRLTIDDDGPAPTQETMDLIHPRAHRAGVHGGAQEGDHWGGTPRTFQEIHRDPERLAKALRRAPDAAALLLADGLARVALGQALEVADGPGRGTRVELFLPLHAGAGDADPRENTAPGPGRGPADDGTDPDTNPDLPLLRSGITRG